MQRIEEEADKTNAINSPKNINQTNKKITYEKMKINETQPNRKKNGKDKIVSKKIR